ncbi:beta-lactamase family protein [candidate division KSB1 bacterium]|nr:beta-lactamase family protein [candidate division KSB1 bacterium]
MEIQKLLDQMINDQKIPGLQCAIQFSDTTIWNLHSGTRGFDREKAITDDDVLRIGSITKLYTAVLVLKAVEEGKFLLSDSLARWYPEITNSDRITISQLLNHTSGLREILENFSAKVKSIFPHKYWKQADLFKLISNQKPYFEPGTDFHYSNSNYIIPGCILEQVYQKSIQQLLHDEIITPLGLKSTFMLPAKNIPENLIIGYDRDLLPWPGIYEHKTDNTAWASLAYTSGGMASTAHELVTFINNIINGKLLSANSLKQMTNFYHVEKQEYPYWTGYGLGLTQFNINGIEYWGHEGMFIGFESIVLFQPQEKYSIALIGNVSSYNRFEIIKRIQGLIALEQ